MQIGIRIKFKWRIYIYEQNKAVLYTLCGSIGNGLFKVEKGLGRVY